MQRCSLWFEELHIWRVSHKKTDEKQIWWSEHYRLKATDFSVAQRGIVGGCEVTGSQLIPHTLLNPSPVFISLTYSCLRQKEEKQISCFSSILVLDFLQRTLAVGAQGPCLYLFIFIYWNELHFASLKGNSLNTKSVRMHSSSPILKHHWKKRLLSCLKTDRFIEQANTVMKAMAESTEYKQLGNRHEFHKTMMCVMMTWEILWFLCTEIVNFTFFTSQSTKMYHSNTMFFGHVPW